MSDSVSPAFRRLRVAEVVAETADTRSFVFDADLDYRPGQFLTLRIPSDRCGSVARSYSLSSSPHVSGRPAVTVKRVDDGYGSNWLCDNVEPGAEFDVLGPAGVFTPRSLDDDLLLFAAGSGITPIMSIVKSVLAAGRGRTLLVYANRDENSVIFGAELNDLVTGQPDRLVVVHWLESVQGLPGPAALRALARPFTDREAFVCGPPPFMEAARKALRELDFPRARLHLEWFGPLDGNPFEDAHAAQPEQPSEARPCGRVEVELDGEQHAFDWPADRRLLDLLLEKGLDAPYSCREGACSACACRIVDGEVSMIRNEVLEEEDLAEGYILACQALPLTETVKVSYD
ncbi:MAG: 2Fe-2S iron-sulfur cluster binding domain-containing protein [Streptosporangiales bacterium]|nr:2Fe-2S iron-sulfur cluster binding domain-containing protein [Streptosporangiales bacterium]